jgi:ArsR family transcriptional regulator, arsenate/arsenite/antimonite-responsive transcriptional repressor
MNINELFKGLAEPTRLRIVILLLERELCVCDLMAVLRLPQSTISRHMSRLKAAGLARDRRDGKWVYYRLEESALVNNLKSFLRRNFAGSEPYANDLTMLKKYIADGQCTKSVRTLNRAVRSGT